MKRIHLGLAGLVLGTTLIQLGCANIPQSTTGSAPETAQALQDHEAMMQVASLPASTPMVALGKMGDPLPGLTQAQLAIFGQGKAVFERTFTPENNDVANDRSCLACHGAGGTLGASDRFAQNVGELSNPFDEAVVGQGVPTGVPTVAGNGFLGHLLAFGVPIQSIPAASPGKSIVVSARLAPPAAGDGVLTAIPDSQLLDREAHQNAALGISGRVARVAFAGNAIGRIGWKLRTPTIGAFTAGAFINELGVSNDGIVPGLFLMQSPADGFGFNPLANAPGKNGDLVIDTTPDLQHSELDATVAFQNLSVPPAPKKIHQPGLAAFKKAGCMECHWTGYTTATSASELAPELQPFASVFLGGKQVPAYTDLLAHNMGTGVLTQTTDLTGQGPVFSHKDGKGNADGIQEGEVRADEYRTAPLWGLRFRPRFMHDGRSTTIEQAIMQHYYKSPSGNPAFDSEANKVIENYLGKTRDRHYSLSNRERFELLTFLRQL